MLRSALLLLSLCACSTDTFNGDGGADAAVEAAACPSEQGFYGFTFSGAGCSTSGVADTACITQLGCNITVTSTLPSDLNTMVAIGPKGGFDGADVQQQMVSRSGCTGVWDGTSTLTIDCGGVDAGQSCRATLTRMKGACPP